MRRMGFAVLPVIALLLGGCESSTFVPWPKEGTGGLAERRPSSDARIFALQERLFRQGERNARYYAAAEYQDAQLMLITVRRLSEGGFPEDCEIEIARLKRQMDKIDRLLANVPRSGKGA